MVEKIVGKKEKRKNYSQKDGWCLDCITCKVISTGVLINLALLVGRVSMGTFPAKDSQQLGSVPENASIA